MVMNFLPRTRKTICLVFTGILFQYIFAYFLWTFFCHSPGSFNFPRISPLRSLGLITCIIRDFDQEANDLVSTIQSLGALTEVSRIIVVSDRKLYPPLNFQHNKLFYFETISDAQRNPSRKGLGELVTTEWTLLVPDGTSSLETSLQDYISATSETEKPVKIWAFRVRGKRASCQSVQVDWKRWTLISNSSSNNVCDAVTGWVVYLVRTENFLLLPEPFMQPIDESLLIQAFAFGWKTFVFADTPFSRSNRLLDPQVLSQQINSRIDHVKVLYERFQIKKTIKNGNEEMFGCSKTTSRCFGTVINELPSYLFEGRYTPPCCVNALKSTLQHVIETFEFNNAAYWLEGGSLLGAARNGQLIPWDYDIDIGMFLNDTGKIQYLQAAAEGPVLDPEGFVWEKSSASEGQFYRVQYSRTNRMHVDIFPFYANNSVMTKDFWFATHPQDREFPERFLTPMESIQFLGLTVAAPNHVREFLELKFGKGCIETPRYPHYFNFSVGGF